MCAPVPNTVWLALNIISTFTSISELEEEDQSLTCASSCAHSYLFKLLCCKAQFKKENVAFKLASVSENEAAGARWPLSQMLFL